MRHFFLLFICSIATLTITAQSLQSPSEFLGYELGTAFTRHADVVRYFEHVATHSDLVTYQDYGKTYERRPLTYAVVTSTTNHNNLEAIRTANLASAGLASGAKNESTAIVWMSYNVHGNEASSIEASMITLYELVTQKQAWLNNTVVIIDPCINPDGRDRYANWYNMVASTPYDVDQNAAEHNEPWPGGRANHYLFDLNRDWAWATQVESQQRLKLYNKWLPHVHVDFHEQGINNPYYFAPAAEPFHEIITDWQRDFQTQIGKNHARYFDAEGWLFFTRERFDLLYPSYGDTYPTYLGSIGMTYEQAGHGRAGLGIQTDEGYELTLKDRIAHHKTTGLSTVEISSQNAQQLNTEFSQFFNNTGLKYKSYVLKGNIDNLNALTTLLDKHEIRYGYATNGRTSGFHYGQNAQGTMSYELALVVSTDQPKGKMVKVLFEPNTELSTPLTYDITAWSLPHAYGLEAVASTAKVATNASAPSSTSGTILVQNAPGYMIPWNSLDDARFLADVLQAGIKVRVSEKPFTNSGEQLDRGTLVITKSDNRDRSDLSIVVSQLATKHNRNVIAATSSFSTSGPDFGSPEMKLINPPKVAILKGDGTSSLSYGATWHFFEQQLGYPLTSIDTDQFGRVDLSAYDVLILPNGFYGRVINDGAIKKVTDWVRGGGKVIAIANALSTFAGKDGFSLKRNTPQQEGEDTDKEDNLTPYADREIESVTNFITGSIFRTKVDTTHPLAFGYGDEYFSLKLGSSSYQYLDNGFNVAWIDDNPENVSGFAGDKAKGSLNKSLIFGEERMGSGSMIYMADDPLFRAFWHNGKLFFANAVFLTNNNVFRL